MTTSRPPLSSRAQCLWQANADLAARCRADAFVAGLASGATPKARFAWYVGQDAAFLEVFARAYALLVARSADRTQLLTFMDLLAGVTAELRVHGRYAARWGIDLETVEPGPACVAYTDFLRGVAALEPVPHVIAAMAPCMRLYAWLGTSLAPQLLADSPYADWVQTYAAPEFQELAERVETLLDLPGGDEQVMAKLYRRAMILEYGFFQACH